MSGHCRQEVQGAGSSALSSSISGADFTNTFYLLSSFPVEPGSLGLADFLTALTTQCASLEELRLAFRPQMDPRWVLGSCFHGVCFRKGTFRTEHMGGLALRECWTVSWAPGGPHGRSTPKTGGWSCPFSVAETHWSEDSDIAIGMGRPDGTGQMAPALGPAQDEPMGPQAPIRLCFLHHRPVGKACPEGAAHVQDETWEICFNKRANRLGPRRI